MNRSAPQPAPAAAVAQKLANMSPEQRLLVQEDLADRERQASSLAAAGMVAESVSLTQPQLATGSRSSTPQPLGLQAPPALGMVAPPASPGSQMMDGINWNMLDTAGGANLDDLDMDFASLFDPANEQNVLGQPISNDAQPQTSLQGIPPPQQPMSEGTR